MILKLSKDAKLDLQEIYEFTLETWSEEQAEIYMGNIYDRLEQVQNDPTKYRFRNDLFTGCQLAIIGRHGIFFKIEKDKILVSRLLHRSMDFPRHLF